MMRAPEDWRRDSAWVFRDAVGEEGDRFRPGWARLEYSSGQYIDPVPFNLLTLAPGPEGPGAWLAQTIEQGYSERRKLRMSCFWEFDRALNEVMTALASELAEECA
jgi:hypothetical protein